MVKAEIILKVKKDALLPRSHEVNFSGLCLVTPDCHRNQNCTGISRYVIVGLVGMITECPP